MKKLALVAIAALAFTGTSANATGSFYESYFGGKKGHKHYYNCGHCWNNNCGSSTSGGSSGGTTTGGTTTGGTTTGGTTTGGTTTGGATAAQGGIQTSQ